ncbi:MAG: hypothetical protein ACRDH5_13155, partial [bacterium]
MQEANLLAGADAIALPPGHYKLTRGGAFEDAALTGDLDVLDDLAIGGAGAAGTRIDADGLDRVLHVVAPRVRVSVSDVTLEGGAAPGQPGGGILNLGELELVRSVLRDHRASLAGGGIFNPGVLVVRDSLLTGNRSENHAGGAIFTIHTGTLDMSGSTVEGNSAMLDVGGIANTGAAVVSDTAIRDNHCGGFGGGIASGIGGGIDDDVGTFILFRSEVSGNSSFLTGGGISQGEGAFTVLDSTISANFSPTGGGGFGMGPGLLTIRNSTVSGNTTHGNGGGVSSSGDL